MSVRAPYFLDGTCGWFLLRRSEVFSPNTLAAAMPMARAIAESVPAEALAPGTTDHEAPIHELARMLATGQAVVCRTARAPRSMDDPEMVDLVDIIEPAEAEPAAASPRRPSR
jgi:hypothetical protein